MSTSTACPLAQERGDRLLGPKERLAKLDMATELGRQGGQFLEIVRLGIGHDVAALRAAHNAPRAERKATDDDKTDFRANEPDEKLVKGRCAQGQAAPHRAVRRACASTRSSLEGSPREDVPRRLGAACSEPPHPRSRFVVLDASPSTKS